MSKLNEKIEHYIAASQELELGLSDDLITKVTVGLGPSIYKQDAETVSCSDSSELDTVKKELLAKKTWAHRM